MSKSNEVIFNPSNGMHMRLLKQMISSEEALKDVAPIEWSEDVLSGEKKVVIDKK